MSKAKFNNIETEFKPEWNTTNYRIPLNKSISAEKFIQQINKLKSDLIDTLHVGDVERPDLFLDKTNSVFKSIEACSDIKTRLQFNGQ